MRQEVKQRAVIWFWQSARRYVPFPRVPAGLLEGLGEGGEVARSFQADPWNCPVGEVDEELRPFVEAILAEEQEGGPVVRPPFARPT